MHFTVTFSFGLKNIVHYTNNFVTKRFFKSRSHCILSFVPTHFKSCCGLCTVKAKNTNHT